MLLGRGLHFNNLARSRHYEIEVNFRLGVFGAFGYPGLRDSGTIGLQDQRAVLQWVQRNAAAFGGDPGNVTLFGVSYGATATSAHLMSKESRGLFHKVIMQSGFTLMDMPAGVVSCRPVPSGPVAGRSAVLSCVVW